VQLRRDLIRGDPRPMGPADRSDSQTMTWLLFTLPEGRTVQMLYAVVTGVLLDTTGSDLYPVPSRWLQPVLGDVAVFGSPEYDLAPAGIRQQQGAGSSLWWVVMLGGGLVCISAAVWLQRAWRERHHPLQR
jgi:hypothetical protein